MHIETPNIKNNSDLVDLLIHPGFGCAWQLDANNQEIEFAKALGLKNSTLYSLQDFISFIYIQDQELFNLNINNALYFSSTFEIEFRMQLNDKIEWIAASGRRIEENKLFGALINISDRRKNAELLSQRQSQLANLVRISSLGEIASMLSHEISQPLVVINTYIAGCIRRLEAGDSDLSSIIFAMNKANEHVAIVGDLMHRMKNYFRKDALNLEIVHIHEVIKGAVTLLMYERQYLPVNIIYEFDESLPAIEIDRLQIKFVILSLLHNSIDAILETQLKNPNVIIRTKRLYDDMLEVSIIDFGCGISPELTQKIFNTYCSTKAQGSGLTLIICRGIMEAHNGELTAANYDLNGTIFSFTLPLTYE